MTNDVLSRRLAVIVAADVVGYSRLMEADEAGTLAQLKSIRNELIDPKIAEHRGRLVKTTGDGLLMEFSSVTDGVQGAIEIQEALAERNSAVPTDRRLLFRLGTNLGEIITEGEDIYGTGVNVAARLELLAEPGGICVSASVHEQIQSLQGLGFEDLGEQLVKNMSRPVRSFALRTQSSDPIAYQRLSRSYSHEADAEGGAHRRMSSIAVLPFTNLSGDPEQEYFADGIAEDIILAVLADAYRLDARATTRRSTSISRPSRSRRTRSRRISGSPSVMRRPMQIELARIQGREILRVAPKFDMALYAKSLTYQDPENSTAQPRRPCQGLRTRGCDPPLAAAVSGLTPRLLPVVFALVELLDLGCHVGDEPDAIAPALALQDPHSPRRASRLARLVWRFAESRICSPARGSGRRRYWSRLPAPKR